MSPEELEKARCLMESHEALKKQTGRALLAHIDEQAKQIETLKAALIKKQYRLMPTAPSCYNDARRETAIEQLACELPEIFVEEEICAIYQEL
jgi:hypothetical protein